MGRAPQARFKVLRGGNYDSSKPSVSPKLLTSAQQIEDFLIKNTRSSENVCSLLHVYGGYMEEDRKVYDMCVCVCC